MSDDKQDIEVPMSVLREAFIDYSDEASWRCFRDVLVMYYNSYTRKREEVNQAGIRLQEEQVKRIEYQTE